MDKGGLSKPQQTYEFLAYLAYELGKYRRREARHRKGRSS
jgi:hypothetical protein